MDSVYDLWRQITPALHEDVGDTAYNVWIKDMEPLEMTAKEFVIKVPSSMHRDVIAGRFIQPFIRPRLNSLLGIDTYGTLKYDELEALIAPETKAIVCTHGCSVTGNMSDLETVCKIARKYKLPVISDGCQTAGAAEVNLEQLEVDVYCFTGHKKLMGPVGIGGVCFARTELKEAFDAANGDAIGEIDQAKLGGLFASLEFILEKGIYGVAMWPHRLAKRFFESSQSLNKVRIYGNFGTNYRVPTIAISVEGFTPEEVKEYLRKEYGIVTKTGHHGSRLMHEALGTADTGLVRVSIGYHNNRFEVNDAIWALMKLTDQMDFYLLS